MLIMDRRNKLKENENVIEIYGGKSCMAEIAKKTDYLLDNNKLIKKSVAIFGLTKLSFCLRTILSRRDILVSAYVCDNEKEVIETQRYEKTFASRYLNNSQAIIPILTFEEWKKKRTTKDKLLIAVKDKSSIEKLLSENELKMNDDYYYVYDGREPEFESLIYEKKQLSLSEIKKRSLEILTFIDEFCNKNNLRYWICGGTLLGAIRHKGFIPWDDDIDIFLPWKDFCLFSELFQSSRFEILKRDNNNPQKHLDYFMKVIDKETILCEDQETYKKVSGIWVDVFPLSGLPENEHKRSTFFADFHEIEKKMWESFYANDGNFDQFDIYYNKQREMIAKYNFYESNYVGVLGTSYGERDCTSCHVYDDTLRMKFEDIMVNVPQGYDEYLSNLYGDYMVLPKETERKSHHNIEVYIRRY